MSDVNLSSGQISELLKFCTGLPTTKLLAENTKTLFIFSEIPVHGPVAHCNLRYSNSLRGLLLIKLKLYCFSKCHLSVKSQSSWLQMRRQLLQQHSIITIVSLWDKRVCAL